MHGRSTAEKALDVTKKSISGGLLIYSIVVVAVMNFSGQTRLSHEVHPSLSFIALCLALIWLSRVEGGQASMVGLPPVDRSLYKDSHPVTNAVCEYGHRGDNLDRYLMGRQFMVLALVFVINMSGTPVEDLKTQTVLSDVFMKSGLALILITAMVGQLSTQVTASHCMLDYTNTFFMKITLYVAIAIEASGMLHASYLIQIIVSKITGKQITSNEPDRVLSQKIFFWGRVLMSSAALAAAFYVTICALFEGKTSMWKGVPAYISVIILFALMTVVGMLEGMQIAFFAVSRITDKERRAHYWSRHCSDLLFAQGGLGLPGFLIGRQLCVASCFIVIARITTPQIAEGQENILGVSDGMQNFFDTGLLGALITTIVASIVWQLVASAFPLAFLGNPITYVLLRVCLTLETTGICSFAWVLSSVYQEFLGFEDDEVHIGTAEEREQNGKGDQYTKGGGMSGGAFPTNFGLRKEKYHHDDVAMEDLEEHMKDLKKQINDSKTDEEKEALQREVSYLEKVMNDLHRKKLKKTEEGSTEQDNSTGF